MKEKHYKDLSGEDGFRNRRQSKQDEDSRWCILFYRSIFTNNKLSTIKRIRSYKVLSSYKQSKISLNKLKIISEELQRYKEQNGLIDFPDMIEKFLDSGE